MKWKNHTIDATFNAPRKNPIKIAYLKNSETSLKITILTNKYEL